MPKPIIGWDVGGAHLKAVLIDGTGMVLAAKQVYCPLWRGLHLLELALNEVLACFNAQCHAVTMTGELADIFANRHDGVQQIAQMMNVKLTGQVHYYAGTQGFVSADGVGQYTRDIASMNWLASVQCVAKNVQRAFFMDIGSTTTDIALIDENKALVRGFADATRMQADELLYTGVVRTPVMALGQKIVFAGQLTNVAAEHFATTADIYTLTGDLAADENMADSADGADKGVEASARRLARMIGWDAQEAPISAWRNLAYAFKHQHLQQIKQAVFTQLSLLQDCSRLHIVGAGAGEFLVKDLAAQLGFSYHSVTDFISAKNEEDKSLAAVCFPAYAVASLGMRV